MRISQVIGLCLLTGVGCGLLGAMIGTRWGDDVHASRSDPHAAAEIRDELRQLRRAISSLLSRGVEGQGVRGDGDEPSEPAESPAPGPPEPTEPVVDPIKKTASDAQKERARTEVREQMRKYLVDESKKRTLRKRALELTLERIETQKQVMLDAARADDLAGLVGAWLHKEDLERATMRIRNSANKAFLSKMAGGG